MTIICFLTLKHGCWITESDQIQEWQYYCTTNSQHRRHICSQGTSNTKNCDRDVIIQLYTSPAFYSLATWSSIPEPWSIAKLFKYLATGCIICLKPGRNLHSHWPQKLSELVHGWTDWDNTPPGRTEPTWMHCYTNHQLQIVKLPVLSHPMIEWTAQLNSPNWMLVSWPVGDFSSDLRKQRLR